MINIDSLSIRELDIPFKLGFEHSSSTRAGTEAVVVTLQCKNGIQTLGEGCPRHYVTGETVDSAVAFFNRYRDDFQGLNSLARLHDWIQQHEAVVDRNPAAFCAVELALLQALAQEAGASLEALLGLTEVKNEYHYSAVVGARDRKTFAKVLAQYQRLGMSDVKVKLFGDPAIDRENLNLLQAQAGSFSRIRFDANNLWRTPAEAHDYLAQHSIGAIPGCFAIEEPLQVGDFTAMAKLFRATGLRIIVDESFLTRQDLAPVERDIEPWIINIRVSKMGGLLRSQAIVEAANKLALPMIVGAQVGETSILTRAGMVIANACHPALLLAQEGAFGTWLLESDLVEPAITFGAGGVVALDTLNRKIP